MISIQYFTTPVGELILGSYEGKLYLADWKHRKDRDKIDKRLKKALNTDYVEASTVVTEEAIHQLDGYFSQSRKNFDLPLLLCGTDFQKSVWEGLMKVSYNETCSYLDLAKKIDKEKAVRAVSTAIGANTLSLFIPCHHIVGSDGSLTGYAGGLEAKAKLLALENIC